MHVRFGIRVSDGLMKQPDTQTSGWKESLKNDMLPHG